MRKFTGPIKIFRSLFFATLLALPLISTEARAGATCEIGAFQKAIDSAGGDIAVQRGAREEVQTYARGEDGKLIGGYSTLEVTKTEATVAASETKVSSGGGGLKVSANGKTYDLGPARSPDDVTRVAYHMNAKPSEVSFTGGGAMNAGQRSSAIQELKKIPSGQKITIKTAVQVEAKARELAAPELRELQQAKNSASNRADPKEFEAKAQEIWSRARAAAQRQVQAYDTSFVGVTNDGQVLVSQRVIDRTIPGQVTETSRTISLDLNTIESFRFQGRTLSAPVNGQ